MISQGSLRLALDLLRIPALIEPMRTAPLPADTLMLIRIAAGCRDTLQAAVRVTGASPDRIREAAQLFLHQVVLYPGADRYRVLGLTPAASRAQLWEHRKWLLTWLHPDLNSGDWEAVLAQRVISAWREIGEKGLKGFAPAQQIVNRLEPPVARRLNLPWIAHPVTNAGLAPHDKATRRSSYLFTAAAILALIAASWAYLLHGDSCETDKTFQSAMRERKALCVVEAAKTSEIPRTRSFQIGGFSARDDGGPYHIPLCNSQDADPSTNPVQLEPMTAGCGLDVDRDTLDQ